MKRKLMTLALAVMMMTGCAATRIGTKNYCAHEWEPAPLWVILQSVDSVQRNGPAATVSLMRCRKCHVLGSDYEGAKPLPPVQSSLPPAQPAEPPPPAPRSPENPAPQMLPGASISIPASATTH